MYIQIPCKSPAMFFVSLSCILSLNYRGVMWTSGYTGPCMSGRKFLPDSRCLQYQAEPTASRRGLGYNPPEHTCVKSGATTKQSDESRAGAINQQSYVQSALIQTLGYQSVLRLLVFVFTVFTTSDGEGSRSQELGRYFSRGHVGVVGLGHGHSAGPWPEGERESFFFF